MKGALVKTLIGLAERDPRILLLTGDLGYLALEPFRDKFPARFFNAGVAEQNMVGVATGLAEAGFLPFVYSIAPFVSLRSYEFIRNGPILQRLQVRVVGIGSGFNYGVNGPTHYGLEDVGVMRIQPGITLVAPADYEQASSAILSTWDLPGPVYYSLSKDDQTVIPGLNGSFRMARAQFIGEGKDLLIISSGSITSEAVRASELLKAQGVSCTLMVIACINPAPLKDLIQALSNFSIAITVEAHYIAGGLGSMVAEVIAEKGLLCRIIRCGVKATPNGLSGSQAYMQDIHGLSARMLTKIALEALERRG